MPPRPRSKANTGWSDIHGGAAFVVPISLLRSPNFARLSANGCKLLMSLGQQYFGNNNGYLSAAFTLLSKFGWKSDTTIREAVAECEHYGLIVKTRQGGRNHCNLYGFTWRRINKIDSKPLHVAATLKPTDDWLNERPPFQKVPRRKRDDIHRYGSH
jgi:hypothetical protein